MLEEPAMFKPLSYSSEFVSIRQLLMLSTDNASFKAKTYEQAVQIYLCQWKPYKQLELAFHRDTPNTRKQWTKTLALRARVFTIIFSCVYIPVKHSLSLFTYYIKHSITRTGTLHNNSRMESPMNLEHFNLIVFHINFGNFNRRKCNVPSSEVAII